MGHCCVPLRSKDPAHRRRSYLQNRIAYKNVSKSNLMGIYYDRSYYVLVLLQDYYSKHGSPQEAAAAGATAIARNGCKYIDAYFYHLL